MILYALLKGYKMNVGGLIEGSIRGYHLSNRRTDPSPNHHHQTVYPGRGEGSLGRRGAMFSGFTSDPYRGYQRPKEQKAKGVGRERSRAC